MSRIDPPRECPPGQGARSPGISYQELLDSDTRRVPD